MTPKTLAEIADLVACGESFDRALGDFLDSFFAEPTVAALMPEPVRLAKRFPPLGEVEDAYLAAMAEWLAWKFSLQLPEWALDESRSLHRPWFASPLASLRGILLLESPAPFRSRNLFVSENALSRA